LLLHKQDHAQDPDSGKDSKENADNTDLSGFHAGLVMEYLKDTKNLQEL
jgi:hypothetical protein